MTLSFQIKFPAFSKLCFAGLSLVCVPVIWDNIPEYFFPLCRYLEVSRRKEFPVLVREGVDTLLMYLYRALNRVQDMEKLASSENSCVVVCALILFFLYNNIEFCVEGFPFYKFMAWTSSDPLE